LTTGCVGFRRTILRDFPAGRHFRHPGVSGSFNAKSENASRSAIPAFEKNSRPGRVAILLAAKDGARFLPEQLESYAAQKYTNWSLHVSDDRSEDETVKIVQDFARRVPNIVTLRDGPCRGSSSNFLCLLRDSSIEADYFAFSDQDDVWYPDKLERALAFMASVPGDRPALYCSRTELIDEAGNHAGLSKEFAKPPSFRNALVQSLAGGNTMVFNNPSRELLKRVADGNVVIHDWMTYIVISAMGGAIFYDRDPSVKYRQHQNNQLGSNQSLQARARRVKMLFAGQWRDWNSIHVKELERLSRDLSDENHRIFQSFLRVRNSGWLLQRYWQLWKSGLYRQTALGNIGLLVAVTFRKI
jgi:glycosyltransferase involved in cell wall biosynthesis